MAWIADVSDEDMSSSDANWLDGAESSSSADWLNEEAAPSCAAQRSCSAIDTVHVRPLAENGCKMLGHP